MEEKLPKPKKKKKTKKAKRRGPRSKYDPELHPHVIRYLALLGTSNADICKALKIVADTLWKWGKKYPEIADALKIGRDVTLSRVGQSLIKRAMGYDYEEVEVTGVATSDGKTITQKIKKTKKHVPPDLGAIVFTLCNLDRLNWRRTDAPADLGEKDELRTEDLAQMMMQVSSQMGGLFADELPLSDEKIIN